MSDGIEEVARRLVVGHKSDGRCVYDEAAKAELVAACARPGASVSRLARECDINANQLSRWLREHSQRQQQRAAAASRAQREAFVAVPIETAVRVTTAGDSQAAERIAPMPSTGPMALQARLPNGVVVELRECALARVSEVIEALGRVRCSASTKP